MSQTVFDACYIFAENKDDMSNTIKRTDVLSEMEIHETSSSGRKYFSIQFYKSDGELVTLTRAKSCGLRMNMKSARKRSVQQVDDFGNAVGHIYPVSIDNIRMFNNQIVKI